MKKIIAILLTLILVMSLSVSVSAEGQDSGVGDNSLGIEENEASRGESGTEYELSENPFTSLFAAVTEYLPEILGALTFIGSLVLAFLYKKGLLPVVKAALSTLTGIVGEIKEKAEQGELTAKAEGEALAARLTRAEDALRALDGSFSELSGILKEAEGRAFDRAALSAVMTTQIDLLYDIFMSSSIPQFQKELVGESVAKMREALSGNENVKS